MINPEYEALDDKPYLVPACCLPDQYKTINIGPPPKQDQVKPVEDDLKKHFKELRDKGLVDDSLSFFNFSN